MTNDDLRAIEQRLTSVTPGPWRASKGPGCRSIGPKVGAHKQAQHSSVAITAGRRDDQEDKANATFIAAAPTDVRRLLDEVHRLKLDEMRWLKFMPNLGATGEYVELERDLAHDMIQLKEVMRLLGKSRLTLFRWIKSGKMPAKKIGAQWYVTRGWVEETKR